MKHGESEFSISVAKLSTEAGVVDAAVKMAQVVCDTVLWPVMDHTPPEQRQALFERFLSALTGPMLHEIGPERAKDTLDAVKRAIDDVMADGKRRLNS